MRNVLLHTASKLNRERKRRKGWQKVLSALSAVVVFCTTYALILPAITMDQDAACGIQAHTHGEDCYEANTVYSFCCDLQADRIVHSHGELCYSPDGALVCPLEELAEHVHTDACFGGEVLTCTEAESEGHTHGDDCYEIHQVPCELTEEPHVHTDACTGTETVQVCTLEEAEGHAHGEGCYTEVQQLICQTAESDAHTHGDSCYKTVTQLSCLIPESEGHAHGAGCFETREKTCDLTTQPHVHSVECSQEKKVLICTTEETEGHTHGEGCYEKSGEASCGLEEIVLHTHADACYDEAHNLICGQQQIVVHIHEDACRSESTEQTLICQLPEHTHEDACYPAPEADDGYLCGSGEHAHHEGCYDAEGVLTCSIPEHTHDASCLVEKLDLNADVETREQWEAEIAKLPLTGVHQEDILTIAQSQEGYTESGQNVVLAGGELKGYTRYGQWKGNPYADWNALFVSFCLEYADLSEYPDRVDINDWVDALQEQKLFQAADAYTPVPGDLVFFGKLIPGENGAEPEIDASRVAIVAQYQSEKGRLYAVEGDADNRVDTLRYDLEDADIVGYGLLPEQHFYCGLKAHYHGNGCYDILGNLKCGLEPHVHNDGCEDDSKRFEGMGRPLVCGEDHTHGDACYGPAIMSGIYEDAHLSMKVSVTAPGGIPDGTRMEVVPMDTRHEAYASYEHYATYEGREYLLELMGYEIRFTLAGEEIQISDGRVTAEITVKPVTTEKLENQGITLMSLLGLGKAEEPEEEVDTVIVSVISRENGDVVTEDKVEFADGETADDTVTVELGLGRSFALMSQTAPQFRVEFYAKMPIFVSGNTETTSEYSSSIQIIDTRGNGDGTGGSLPRNGSQTSPLTDRGFMYLYLEPFGYTDQNGSPNPPDNNLTYHLASKFELTEIYKADTRTYTPGMTNEQLNKIRLNSHYIMTGMQVSQDGGQTWRSYGLALEDDEDVDVFINDLSKVSYTNNPATANDSKGIIYVSNNTVIRFTYNVLEGTHSNAVNFFDYEISDGDFHTNTAASNSYSTFKKADDATSGAVYINTNKQGINNGNAYAGGSGAEFAFGNNNTGMGRADEMLGSAYINRYNRANLGSVDSFNGCSFGIVSGYDIANDRLLYKSGVHYQALFNDEAYYNKQSGYTQMGKTTYTGNMLNFRRIGDNYILAAVNGSGAVNGIYENRLDEFFVPNEGIQYSSKKRIFTNNFWPMDGTVNDNTTGRDPLFGEDSEYTSGHRSFTGTSTGSLPQSDDHNFHNSYFGMQYSVKFSLDGHYCGPLEYLFYGDDDMWVFLTDHQTGASKLICDIGGVHSSVGSYTNLWDYIKKDDAGKGDYTLTFFYTERGSSGSSCFMSFTLPMITSVSQNTPDLGSLSVVKEAIDESDPNATYTFKLELSDQVGAGDRYPYIISGTAQSSGTIASGETFTVAAGETFTVSGIPAGMKYAVTELFSDALSDAYTVAWQEGDGTSTIHGTIIADKVIEGGKTETLICTNSAVGTLKLLKEVDGAPTTKTFYLEVSLADKDGNPVSGTFGGIEFVDGKGEVPIAQDQAVIIPDLPVGTQWTVTEKSAEGYSPAYKVDGADAEAPSGIITHDHQATVTVINTAAYTLPNTGGMGTRAYTFGGLLILAAALMYSFILLRKRRGEAEV